MDAEQGMVDLYKKRIGELGTRHVDTRVVAGNLLVEPEALTGDEYRGFDLITVGAALHAFPSGGDAVRCLAERLGLGGVLFVQDRFDDGWYGGRGPRGFTLDDMRDFMGKAGLVEFRFEVLPDKLEIEMLDGEVVSIWCFVARGMKPGGE